MTAKPSPLTASAKPTTAKTPAPKDAPAVPKKAGSEEVFARWKSGTRISDLVKTFKLTRPEIRRLLLEGAGSREAFKALRQQGAGGPLAIPKRGPSQ